MTRLEPHPSVVCTVIDDGGVLLHLDTKYYYSLNGTGMRVWNLLEVGHPDPVAILGDGNGRGEAIRNFLSGLAAESLVAPAASAADAAGYGGAMIDGGAADHGPREDRDDAPWTTPQFVKHEVPLNQILSNPFDPSVPLAE